MPRSETVIAIVLQSYDVGEADRFAILFTRELGRIAARVPAARRLGSTKASVLPSSKISAVLRRGSAGFVFNSSELISSPVTDPLEAYAVCMESQELLLRVLQEEDYQPELFDVLDQLLIQSKRNPKMAFLGFGVRFISLLGLLPDPDHLPKGMSLSDDEKVFLRTCINNHTALPEITEDKGLRILLRTILPDVLSAPLKTPSVVREMLE